MHRDKTEKLFGLKGCFGILLLWPSALVDNCNSTEYRQRTRQRHGPDTGQDAIVSSRMHIHLASAILQACSNVQNSFTVDIFEALFARRSCCLPYNDWRFLIALLAWLSNPPDLFQQPFYTHLFFFVWNHNRQEHTDFQVGATSLPAKTKNGDFNSWFNQGGRLDGQNAYCSMLLHRRRMRVVGKSRWWKQIRDY
jgi:hypothetical protein